MRNLKKVLALVLAMAMALSLAVTAGAAFNDQDKIVNEEAVDMCSALNIINGYTDGSFKPEGNVTRAEAAKMITIALNGGKEPTLSASSTPTYSDIAGHWAAKYIEYCTSLGIVAGDGAGKFNPNGNVKAVELAKMLLIALGYNADTEKFVGANWDTNVNVVASQKDIYEGLETIDPSVAATRDTAAQMVWNALQAYTVEYEYKLNTVNGTLTSELVVKDKLVGNPAANITLMGEKYGAVEFQAVLNGYNAKQAAQFTGVKYTDGTAARVTFNDYTKDDSDLIGRDVTILAKADRSGNYTIYGLFEDSDFTYIETIAGDVTDYKAVNSATDKDTVKVDGTKYDVAAAAAAGVAADDAAIKAISDTDSALPVIVKVNDDDEIVSITAKYSTFNVAEVTFVGSKTITAGTSYDVEDVEAYDGIAKEDWVVIHENDYTGNMVMSKADVVSGEVTKVKGNDVTIGGTVYTKATSLSAAQAALLTLTTNVEIVAVDGYIYNVEKVAGIASLEEVVYISGMKVDDDYGKESITAKATFADGTAAEIDVVKVNANDTVAKIKTALTSATALNGLYKFEVEDGEYTLNNLDVGSAATDDFEVSAGVTSNSTQAGDNTIADMRVNDDAVVFLIDKNGDVSVKDGKTVKAWKDSVVGDSYAYGNKVNGVSYADVAVVAMAADQSIPGASNDAVYGFVLSYDGSTKNDDNDTVYTYTLWTAKGEQVVTTDTIGAVPASTSAEGTFVVYEDGKLATTSGNIALLTGIDGTSTVFFNNADQDYNVTSDTQVVYINFAAGTGVEGGSLVIADDVDGDLADEANVYVQHDASDRDPSDGIDLLYLFVDVNNDINNDLGN